MIGLEGVGGEGEGGTRGGWGVGEEEKGEVGGGRVVVEEVEGEGVNVTGVYDGEWVIG